MATVYFLAFILFIKSVGDIGLNILRVRDIPARGIISFAFGFVITSYILRFIFSWAVWGSYVFTIIICLVILFNIRPLSKFLKDLLKRGVRFFREECGIFERTILLILFIQAAFNLLICFPPATAWDGLSFHLAIPKLIMEKGSMIDLDYYGAGRHPLFTQMIFTLALLLKGEQLVHLISWLTGVLTIIGIFSLSKMLGLGKIGLAGGAIFYCTQVVSMWTATSYIDIYLAFFSIMALSVILIYLRTRAREILILSFIFISILSSIKISGIFLVLIMGVFLVINLFRRRERRLFSTLISIFIFFLIFAGTNMPWYYESQRDVSETGSMLQATAIGKDLPAKGVFNSYLKKLSFALWDLTLNYEHDGRISPFFLTFIPFLFLVKTNYQVNMVLAISLAYIGIFSFFITPLSRYVLPIMPFLSLVSAYVVYRLLARDCRTFRLLKLYLIFSFIFNLGLSIYNHLFEIDYLTGKVKRDGYIARKVSCFRVTDYINKNIETGRILLLGETRSYYLERKYLWGRKLNQVPRESLLEKLRDEGVTHILASHYIIYKRRPDIKAQEILDEIKDKKKTIYEKGGFGVYQLILKEIEHGK